MESRLVAPAAATSEGRRVDGEDGVRLRWEQPAGPLSRNAGLSVLCCSGGTHALSLPFSKVRRRRSPSPTFLSPLTELAAPSPTTNQELFQAGTDQRDLAGKGAREGGAKERALGESGCPLV